jgi:uncharacterized protein (TIGR03663 family)
MELGSDRRISLTYEHVLWALIAVVALVMRVARLDTAPLNATEAREAVLAWRAATGQGVPLAGYNPVLLATNSLLFMLFGAGDALARLLPAVFGTCLALAPMLFRGSDPDRRLGRVGALVSGLYLAISPTALVASRQLDGMVVAAAGAMALVGGLVRFLESERRGWLVLAAVGLALGVTAGASVYALLLPLALACVILSQLRLGTRLNISEPAVSRVARHAPRLLLTFVVALLLFATGLGWNLPGLGASGRFVAEWIGRFRPAPDPAVSPLTLLAVYELGIVVFGVGGLIWGALRRDPAALLLGLWGGLEVLLLALMPGRVPTDALWAVVPLAMLSGWTIERLVDRSSSAIGLAPSPGPAWMIGAIRTVHFAVVLILWGHAYLMLARYASFADRADLVLALITLVLQGLVGLSFGMIVGWDAVLRTVARGTAVVLLALTLRAGWRVAYRRPNDPREPLLSGPTPLNVRDLAQTLEDISWQETGMPTTLAFTVEAPQNSVLAWYLRGFDEARRVDRLGDLAADEVESVVVTAGRDETVISFTGREYAGQDFPVRRQWTPRDLGCRFWESGCHTAYGWFLFRNAVPLPEADRWATIWRASELSRGE